MLRTGRTLAVCTTLLLGCQGGTGLSTGRSSDAGAPPGPSPEPDSGRPAAPEIPPLADGKSVPGPAPFRRLDLLEYNNTIRDLVGAGAPVFTRERLGDNWATSGGFSRGPSVTLAEDVRGLLASAEEVAAAAVKNLATLLPCSASIATRADEDACADEFITHFGLRAFRRPLAAAEQERLRAVYQRQRGPEIAASFSEAINDVITAMLIAPEFLYRRELGPGPAPRDGKLIRFNGYELASRLSYLFWRSMPDQALFTAAADGKLATTTQLVAQARRLLADDRARDAVADFHRQLVEVDGLEQLSKDAAFTNYSPAVARALVDETRSFAAGVFFGPQADGKLQTLLTSPRATVDGPLARYYGVPAPAGMAVVDLPAKQRAGLFTRGAFLATKADPDVDNPVRRADTILRRLLCLPLREPDNVAIPAVPDVPATATTRQRFESHGKLACAVECHQKIVDPIGYAFEHYDATGGWRTTENGQPVDSHATVILPTETFEFDDAIALSTILAGRADVHDCMSTQWLRYQLGRAELADERPSAEALADFYRHSDDLRELMVALVRARTFTHRSPSPGEPTP